MRAASWLCVFLAASSVLGQGSPVRLGEPTQGVDFRRPSTGNLSEVLLQLKTEREALGTDHRAAQTLQTKEILPPKANEPLKARLGELLNKLESQKKVITKSPIRSVPLSQIGPPFSPKEEKKHSGPEARLGAPLAAEANPVPAPKTKNPAAEGAIQPVDPLALGQAFFRIGKFDGALKALRQVPLTGLKAEERVPVQYLVATCLRRLGKNDEAAAIYREVANSRGDEQLAACAQWQLGVMRWHREMQERLTDIRQRQQALEKNP